MKRARQLPLWPTAKLATDELFDGRRVLAAQLHGMPHVLTAHSLEPLRPWKAEQLGGGYALSSWCERTAMESAAAVIAVSDGMRADILSAYPALPPGRVHVIRNGIDTSQFTRLTTSIIAKAMSATACAWSVRGSGRPPANI